MSRIDTRIVTASVAAQALLILVTVICLSMRTDAAAQDLVTVGPNAAADYRSVGFIKPALLQPGFDLKRARLSSRDDDAFPDGRQFIYVRRLYPPGGGSDRTRLLEQLDLGRFRELAAAHRDSFHVLLVKDPGFEWNIPPDNVEFTVEELWAHPEADKLEGPWTLWVDKNNIITRLTSIADFPLSNGGGASAATSPQYVCVQDGEVLGSLNDYVIQHDDQRFLQVFEDCLSGRLGSDWLPVPYGSNVVAPHFTLHDGAGGELSLGDLLGRPFILVAPAPEAQEPVQLTSGVGRLNAVEPAPSVRLELVNAVLDAAELSLPVVTLALPYIHDSVYWDAASVARALRSELGVPVYEDSIGTLLNNYSQYLAGQNLLILVDARGRIVDAFADMVLGPGSYPEMYGRKFVEVLQYEDLNGVD
jgi:hypothetical protein